MLKWRVLFRLQSRRADLWPASDLLGHCQDSVPACKHSKSSDTLDKERSESCNSWDPRAKPQGLKSYDLQCETNSIVNIKPNQLWFNWWWYQFAARGYRQEPWKLQFEVSPVGVDVPPRMLSHLSLQIAVTWDFPCYLSLDLGWPI